MIATRFARRAALPGLLVLCALPTQAVASTPSSGGFTAETAVPAAEASAAPATESAPAPTDVAAESTATHRGELAGLGVWNAPKSVPVGRPVNVSGRFDAALVGRTVRLQRKTPSNRWMTVATSLVRKSGDFSATWRTRAARNHDLRLLLLAARGTAHTTVPAAATNQASGPVQVAVLATTKATWYGPGFYGGKTACGLRLTRSTEGVAHRTLPCGTKVEIRLGSRSVVLPVIDRGPFANGADLDLTKNVANRIGITGVSTVQYAVRHDLPRISTPYKAPAIYR